MIEFILLQEKKSFSEYTSVLKMCHVCLFATLLVLLNVLKYNLPEISAHIDIRFGILRALVLPKRFQNLQLS